MPTLTTTGIGSGIDVEALVTGLLDAERVPATKRLDRQEVTLQVKLTAMGSLKGSLSEFKTATSALTEASVFASRRATVGDETVITSATTGDAVTGNYDVVVSQLAKTHKLASGAFSSATTTVGSGTLQFNFGSYDATETTFTRDTSRATQSISISVGTDSLADIRNAVNSAKAGVTASIINDGSGERLVFSSSSSGSNNSLEISVIDNDGNATDNTGLSQLAFGAANKNMSTTSKGQNAALTIDGLAITSSNNSVTGAIQGIDLTLKTLGNSTLTIDVDRTGAKNAINGMVESYNTLMATLDDVTSYDKVAKTAGALISDAGVRGIKNQLRNIISTSFNGNTGALRTLADLGITTQRDGTLLVDDAILTGVLADHYEDIAGVFANVTKTSDPLIKVNGATSQATPGTYSVRVNSFVSAQVASASVYTATANSSLVVGATNNTLSIQVDGINSGIINLTQQTYLSGAALAAELQTQINSDATLIASAKSVSISYIIDHLSITSASTGATSLIDLLTVGATSSATLGLSVAPGVAGQNEVLAAATGQIGGINATSDGDKLHGGGGANGLSIQVQGGALGARGEITYSTGIAQAFGNLMDNLLATDGLITSRTTGLEKSVDKIDTARTDLAERLTRLEQRMRDQFNYMDGVIAQLNATGTFLQQQIDMMTAQKN